MKLHWLHCESLDLYLTYILLVVSLDIFLRSSALTAPGIWRRATVQSESSHWLGALSWVICFKAVAAWPPSGLNWKTATSGFLIQNWYIDGQWGKQTWKLIRQIPDHTTFRGKGVDLGLSPLWPYVIRSTLTTCNFKSIFFCTNRMFYKNMDCLLFL